MRYASIPEFVSSITKSISMPTALIQNLLRIGGVMVRRFQSFLAVPALNIPIKPLVPAKLNRLRFSIVGALTVTVCATFMAKPAQADWYAGYVGSPNYGSDYYSAACAQMHHYYSGSVCGAAIGFGKSSGVVVSFSIHGHQGGFGVTGIAANNCTVGVRTMYGCATQVDQQGANSSDRNGCGCDSGVPNKNGKVTVGEPVDIGSGNLSQVSADFKTVGQDSLTSTLYYNSNQGYSTTPNTPYTSSHDFLFSRFGYGWRSEYDRFIVPNNSTPSSATAVDAIRADGTPVHFALSSSIWYVAYWVSSSGTWSTSSSPRHNIKIKISTDGTYWYITDDADTVDKYDATGKLLTITYRNGYSQALTYDASNNNTVVTDSFGRYITFAYLANGLVSSVTDTSSHVTSYAYVDRSSSSPPPSSGTTGLWALQSVTYPDTTSRTYAYTDVNPINRFALTGITDENGNGYATWTYDSTTGRALSSKLGSSANLTTISYDDTTPARTVTNALGKQTIYYLASFQGNFRVSSAAGQASTHTPASTVSYTYDSNGYMNQMTSGESRVTAYTSNSVGQQTSRTDGYGSAVARTISTTWDATFNLPDQITEPNLTSNFTYTSGKLTQLTQTDTTTQTIPYSTNGQTRTWNYTYYASGLLDTVQGPLGTGDTTTYTYNSSGFVSSVTDPLSHVTTISSWNVWGEPLVSVDANGITTNYTYDLRARLKSVTVNPGSSQAVTSFGYDNAGNLTSITQPDGSSLSYAYNAAHQLTTVTNNLSETITYTLDAMGDRTQTVVKSASSTITKSQTATFDELARMLTEIGASSQTTTYAYDKDNNQVSVTDPRSKLYQYAFDAIERVMRQTDPDSYQTGISYNGKSEITSITDARSLTTSYIRDGFGDAIGQTSPDTGTTTLWYDAHGNVTKRIDARSVEADFTYDALNRVLTKTFPAHTALNITYTYDSTSGGNDGVGRLTSVTDSSGSTSFVYNALGQAISDNRVISANTYAASYTFNPAGNPLTITYPSGRIVTFTRDSFGRISGITTKQNSGSAAVTIASSVVYEPFGPLAGLTYGNGSVLTRTYDQDYQLTGIVAAVGAGNNQSLTNGYDASGNITSITDNLNSARSQTISYDDLNRVASAIGVYGSQSYSYDGVGNRLMRVIGGTTETYAYSSSANQISSVTSGGNVRSVSYTASGQVSQDVRDPSNTYTFAVNDDGRNDSASLNGSAVGTYSYNGFQQRMQKTVGSALTQFIFDRFGHLLEEANSSGVVQKEYIWLDDLPVAIVDDTGASPVIYYIQADQLDTPQKIADGSANIVWDAVFDPFGNMAAVSGTNWGAANWGSFTWEPGTPYPTNLRFPGQYSDAETALNQNWNRDYDPTIGRYSQSDPMGLGGGFNTYAYVGSNPLNRDDLSGLFVIGPDWLTDAMTTISMTTAEAITGQPFRWYGEWGGPGWASGGWRPEIGTIPAPGQFGYAGPIDAQDTCYMHHDMCLHDNTECPVAHGNLYVHECDYRLRDCLNALPHKTLQSRITAWGFDGPIQKYVH
jgi:RHS repeat-associated protein